MSERILVIKLGALGDFCLSIGMMKAIRKKHPKAHLTLLTGSGMVKIAEQSGFFDEILIDNRPRYNLKKWWYVCQKVLADMPFDLIYDLQSSRRTFKKYYPIAIEVALGCTEVRSANPFSADNYHGRKRHNLLLYRLLKSRKLA